MIHGLQSRILLIALILMDSIAAAYEPCSRVTNNRLALDLSTTLSSAQDDTMSLLDDETLLSFWSLVEAIESTSKS